MDEFFYENHIELREASAELSTVSPEFIGILKPMNITSKKLVIYGRYMYVLYKV